MQKIFIRQLGIRRRSYFSSKLSFLKLFKNSPLFWKWHIKRYTHFISCQSYFFDVEYLAHIFRFDTCFRKIQFSLCQTWSILEITKSKTYNSFLLTFFTHMKCFLPFSFFSSLSLLFVLAWKRCVWLLVLKKRVVVRLRDTQPLFLALNMLQPKRDKFIDLKNFISFLNSKEISKSDVVTFRKLDYFWQEIESRINRLFRYWRHSQPIQRLYLYIKKYTIFFLFYRRVFRVLKRNIFWQGIYLWCNLLKVLHI